MELGERSADMAEAAPALGFEGLTPTSEITPEQAAALRARFSKTPVPPAGALGAAADAAAPAAWGAPPGAPPSAGPAGSGGSKGPIVAVAVVVVAVIGLFAFMMTNSGPDHEREQKLAADAAAHDAKDKAAYEAAAKASGDVPTVTAPPDSANRSGPDAPIDADKFCSGATKMGRFEDGLVAPAQAQDWPALARAVSDHRTEWNQSVDEMKAFGPPKIRSALDAYVASYGSLLDDLAGVNTASDMSAAYGRADQPAIDAASGQFFPVITDICA